MAIHERVWERPDAGYARPDPVRVQPTKPLGTYGLLGAIGVTFVLQLVTLATSGEALHDLVFTIGPSWYLAPWSLVTSTLAHGGLMHILFNGLVLFFFGPHLERILGTRKFVPLFLAAGALSGILQVTLQPGNALGASGAINMVFGALVMLMPKAKVLLWGILPLQFWVVAVAFAVLDVLGLLGYGQAGIGNIAHLSGLAMGLLVGQRLKKGLEERGLRIQY